jgi:hypothetical protein
MGSAAMAYLGYKQIETTLTSYNQTATDLENLLVWWTALPPDEQASSENTDKLVTTTEQVLATEQDGWAQKMTNALEALRTRQAEDAGAREGAIGAPAAGAAQVGSEGAEVEADAGNGVGDPVAVDRAAVDRVAASPTALEPGAR